LLIIIPMWQFVLLIFSKRGHIRISSQPKYQFKVRDFLATKVKAVCHSRLNIEWCLKKSTSSIISRISIGLSQDSNIQNVPNINLDPLEL